MKKIICVVAVALCLYGLGGCNGDGNKVIEIERFSFLCSFEAPEDCGFLSCQGYHRKDPSVEFDTFLIRNVEECQSVLQYDEFFQKYFDTSRYDEKFFQKHGIVLAYFKYSSSEKEILPTRIGVGNGKMLITFNIQSPTVCDSDIYVNLYIFQVVKEFIDNADAAVIQVNNTLLRPNSSFYYH